MKPNPGYCPDDAKGKRVVVQLANGNVAGESPVSPSLPAGWAAEGKGACRWTLTGDPFDIAFYEIAK